MKIPDRILRKPFPTLLLMAIVFSSGLQAQTTHILVDSATQVIDGTIAPYNNVHPGDTVFIAAGNRNKLQIRNFRGTETQPILFTNKGGDVVISTNEYYGLSIINCRYFRISGTGSNSQYGIRITKVLTGAGVGIGNLSSDFEMDHLSVENCLTAGVYAKTEPDCSFTSTRDRFTQYNTSIHDNFINNTGNEGLYVGSSSYAGIHIICSGRDTTIHPPLLAGVSIYNNIIQNAGWDAIQVSSASKDCKIFNNNISHDSQSEMPNQMAGILMGGGSSCDCYNNLIMDGKGDGIENHGLGGNRIFNNIIVNAGRTYKPTDLSAIKHGIFISDITTHPDSSYYILFNDIINPKSDGIRFQSTKSHSSLIASNLIINPGNYQVYASVNAGALPQDAYIRLPQKTNSVTIRNNFLNLDFAKAGISATDYQILPGSPLINTASPENHNINIDYRNGRRPYGGLFDIGAMEFSSGPDTLLHAILVKPLLFPNPVIHTLTIRYFSTANQENRLQIRNSIGLPIMMQVFRSTTTGMQEIQLPVAQLPAGHYICTVFNGSTTDNCQFIKL